MKIGLLGWQSGAAAGLSDMFRNSGHRAILFEDCDAVKRYLKQDTIDLMMVNWDAAVTNGTELLGWFKSRAEFLPVLIAADGANHHDIVAALEAGADEYITIPIQPAVLAARISALERLAARKCWSRTQEDYGRFKFDLSARRYFVNGEDVALTTREFDLALAFFRNHGRTLSRSYLYEEVWGCRSDLQTRTLDVHISKLRTKAGLTPANGCRLQPVYGFGYRLECGLESLDAPDAAPRRAAGFG